MNISDLEHQGKTLIYKESETELTNTDWDLWGKRTSEDEDVFVYRKIVTFEEAEQHEIENELLN